jgi:acyl-CoA thioesterase-1
MILDKSSVMFLGDSITKGVSFIDGKYRVLEKSFFNILSKTILSSTENRGRFGLTSRRFLKDLFKLNGLDADITFFGIGVNDCNLNWKEREEHPEQDHFPAVSKEEYENNLCRIYDNFKESQSKIITLNCPPLHAEKFFSFLGEYFNAENIMKWLKNISRIYYHHESYNNIFEKVTRSYGIEMIDIRGKFLMDDNLDDLIGIDGMHPKAAGHELISGSISNFLNENAAIQ